ncbi:hypothetical protein ASG39_11180 [Rhizobium sp. Leaf371]|uniref:hypothetical protein n=1 Tax=Rhizobium sp. Leaf371 TaxID=1736355 RepID=UPI0007158000|nr:hypothetical protein [Rhizobium sp. Leaf371]KQS64510.1 hypothetical protein ASG39_11180 [Rhizobium sp. Leaf371]
MKFLKTNWQAFVFAAVGFFALYHFYRLLEDGKVTDAGVVFGIAFLSFLYANLSRFKKFSGLGFEAELWEDKQREASDLIDRLKNVVSIYTREIVLSAVKEGRWSDGRSWKEHWKLYDELVSQHDALGQKIDFTALKTEMDAYFLLDMCFAVNDSLRRDIDTARSKALTQISTKYGKYVTTGDERAKLLINLEGVTPYYSVSLELAKHGNIGAHMLEFAENNSHILEAHFGFPVDFNPDVMARLRKVAKLAGNRPVPVTDETLALTRPV